ncbi:MAG: FkbM family methyltransferase [Clostridiales bacterium]|nr:FkbM family methyltransferase [Clostridiales bacterium]
MICSAKKTDIWQYLTTARKPVVLYGTGNGADKILDQLILRNIPVSGVFASSTFVRDRSFRGFKVETYEALRARFPDMIVLVCFGTSLPDVLSNIDRIRSECEVYAPDVPVYGKELFDSAFCEAHAEELEAVRGLLCDDLSRETFDRVINYKLTGDYMLLRPCESALEDITSILSLPDPAHYIDLGAYNGDTVAFYSKLFPQISKILAVEPDKRNFRKLNETVQALFGEDQDGSSSGDKKKVSVSCIRSLISDHDGTAFVPRNRGRGVHETEDADKGEELTATSLVTLLRDLRADLIKMDVEGNELLAIRGGENIILRDKPSLIVSCYHKSEDLFTLPLLLKKLVPEYNVYMRHHPHLLCWDTEFIFSV